MVNFSQPCACPWSDFRYSSLHWISATMETMPGLSPNDVSFCDIKECACPQNDHQIVSCSPTQLLVDGWTKVTSGWHSENVWNHQSTDRFLWVHLDDQVGVHEIIITGGRIQQMMWLDTSVSDILASEIISPLHSSSIYCLRVSISLFLPFFVFLNIWCRKVETKTKSKTF